MENKLTDIIEQAQRHHAEGNRRNLRALLKAASPSRRNYYQHSHQLNLHSDFADLLYKTLWLELDEEEEESIELAELAYTCLSEGLNDETIDMYEQIKKRIILLHYFADYFTDSIIEIFLKKYRAENLLQARSLALESLERMQLSDIFQLEQAFSERIDRDDELADVCNTIELAPNLTDKELSEAELMHRVLQAYLRAKYK